MKTEEPRLVHLKDYRPPEFLIENTDLTFRLEPEATRVSAELEIARREPGGTGTLHLDGSGLSLKAIAIDGNPLDEGRYSVDENGLTITGAPDRFILHTEVEINPKANTALEGLYMSNGRFCTQCEAEGFRRITWYLDRPDVMATFQVRMEADKKGFPVLLSNGNPVESGDLEGGRHFAVWHDPFPKPSYLFALVAGDLAHIEDSFTTMSGRTVRLRIYSEPGKESRCTYAMDALKRAMRWDEEVFGREYDLDLFNIVAVSDFNMGAMENKGLNIFNDALLLASPETATDLDYARIESVVAHEYFHNWTGNRITCRDWFELSLKEGLTVFRDQQFSADMRSTAVKRIEDVRDLRRSQFAEDASALAHPVRPENYAKIDNFYTATVYIKGAEVIRMLYNIVGPEGFRKGTDLYFERHDGQAVRIEDWVKSFEDACGRDLAQFRRWYSQAGTPVVTVSGRHDPANSTYELTLKQETPPTPGQREKLPLTIPVSVGLLDREGKELPLVMSGESGSGAPTTRVLELSEPRQTFTFENVKEPPTPSLLRGFSAPVSLRSEPDEEERLRLIGRDGDPFVRWETAQVYARDIILDAVADRASGREMQFPSAFGRALRDTLVAHDLDPAFRAQMLMLPAETELALAMKEVDVDGLYEARTALRRKLARDYEDELRSVHHDLTVNEPYDPGSAAAGRRSLRNACLSLLCAEETQDSRGLALHHYEAADNMTDCMAALSALSHMQADEADEALEAFYKRWHGDALVVNKWLALHALSTRADTLERVKGLARHSAFSLANPNKVRALIGAFAFSNPVRFHAPDGGGYAFFADMMLELDRLNPAVAARLLTALRDWKRYDPARREKMKTLLERLKSAESLSENSSEIVHRTLQTSRVD